MKTKILTLVMLVFVFAAAFAPPPPVGGCTEEECNFSRPTPAIPPCCTEDECNPIPIMPQPKISKPDPTTAPGSCGVNGCPLTPPPACDPSTNANCTPKIIKLRGGCYIQPQPEYCSMPGVSCLPAKIVCPIRSGKAIGVR